MEISVDKLEILFNQLFPANEEFGFYVFTFLSKPRSFNKVKFFVL